MTMISRSVAAVAASALVVISISADLGARAGSDQGQTGVRPGSDRGQSGVRPGSDRGQTGVRPGSDQGQTGVRPGSDQGQTGVSPSGSFCEGAYQDARGAVFELSGRTPVHEERGQAGAALRRRVQHALRDQPTRAQALIRDASARGRRRLARHSGAPRPRPSEHHAALHARERRAVDRDVQEGSPEGVAIWKSGDVEIWKFEDFQIPRFSNFQICQATSTMRRPRGYSIASVLIL
jgi:hypothetical protein